MNHTITHYINDLKEGETDITIDGVNYFITKKYISKTSQTHCWDCKSPMVANWDICRGCDAPLSTKIYHENNETFCKFRIKQTTALNKILQEYAEYLV